MTWRRQPPTRSPTTTSTRAGSAATGAATEIDFSVDRRQWEEAFSDLERRAALWNYSLFFWGEDAVADNLSPFIDAAPREEQKYFLATQQVDEARHASSSSASCARSAGIGDGTVAGGLDAIRPQLTWGFVKTFELLDKHADELRRDRSRTKLAQAVTLYHVVVEAALAQPGQHFIEDYLDRARPACPASAPGCATSRSTSSATSASASSCCATSRRRTRRCRDAVADLLREVLPYRAGVFVPPGWDRALHGVLRLHARGDLRGGRALVREQAARRRAADRVAARPDPVPVRPAAGRARAAR